MRSLIVGIILGVVLTLAWEFLSNFFLRADCDCADAAEIKDADAVDAIVGEAADQDYTTMTCIAQAIRNRGTLRGVYGLHARHNRNEPAEIWYRAQKAWKTQSHFNLFGAKNFGTSDDLKKLNISDDDVKAICGDFYFY